MSMTEKCADYFYTADAKLCEKTTAEGYTDTAAGFVEIKDIRCDIQPCSGGIMSESHGRLISEGIKVFCGKDSDITVGKYLMADGVFYVITNIKRWSMGYELSAERAGVVKLNASTGGGEQHDGY